MSEIKKDGSGFRGFEYKEIPATGKASSYYLDCYPSFGWTVDERTQEAKGKIVLRRERNLVNKMELTRLQRQFESCMEEINGLEQSKTSKATIAALVIAIIGCVFLAGSVFAVVHEPPLLLLSIVLAVPGFVGWLLPYFVYRKLVSKRTTVVNELVERKYDEIYEVCQQGSQLLN